MLPNFLILGAQKAGTTSLYHVLRKHPDAYIPETKEIGFFFQDEQWNKGTEWYSSFFDGWEGQKAVGEATPSYINYPEVPKRIAQTVPDARLIAVLRNPVDRAYSQYMDNRKRLTEPLAFRDAIERRGYIARGFYHEQIARYLEYFPREQMLILLFDDLVSKPKEVYKDCFSFLDIEEDFECPEMLMKFNSSESAPANPLYGLLRANPLLARYTPIKVRFLAQRGRKKRFSTPPIPEDVRKDVAYIFTKDIENLEDLLSRDLSHWRVA